MTPEIILARMTECGIPCPAEASARLSIYHDLLLDWNTRMDLTAVSGDDEMLDRHYVDSLSALAIPGLIPEGASIIDVGTGAGFPGLPLAIARPDLKVTLLDAQQKRLNFLAAVAEACGLTNVAFVHARAEDGARQPEHRAHYDMAVARAVAPLPVLSEYLLPYVRTGGSALCWKGPALADELQQGRRAAFLLGGRVGEPIPVTFPGRDWTHLLLPIEKTGNTPKIYPRKAGTPSKKPLGA